MKRNPLLNTTVRLSLADIQKKGGYVLENTTDTPKKVLVAQPLFTGKKPLHISSSVHTISGETPAFKLLDRNLGTLQTFEVNRSIYLEESRRISFVGIHVPPHSRHEINALSFDVSESIPAAIQPLFKGDLLLLLPSLPSEHSLEGKALLSYTAKLKEANHTVDLVVIASDWQGHTEIADTAAFGTVFYASYNDIRLLLQTKLYSAIVAHWFDEKLAQMLDGSDLSSTKLTLHPRVQDVLLSEYEEIHRQYFQHAQSRTPETTRLLAEKERVLRKYSKMPNVAWVFADETTKTQTEKALGAPFTVSHIGNMFDFLEVTPVAHTPSDRFTVGVVSDFAPLHKDGVDIAVRALLELHHTGVSDGINVSVHGNGPSQSPLTAPLRDLPHVAFHPNMTLEQLSAIDILLQPVRAYSDIRFIELLRRLGRPVIEHIAETVEAPLPYDEVESFAGFAKAVENHIAHSDTEMEAAATRAVSLNKEVASRAKVLIELYRSDAIKAPSYKAAERDEKPLLTITVPSYNCEKFLMNGILSLINHPLAHRLEILIVNDGSKDKTAEVGRRLEELVNTGKLPVVRLIDKENGGHGSTINAGIREATGKYFRLMDGDDYFYTENFEKLLRLLEKEDSDIVLTNYVEDFAITATKNTPALYDFMTPGLQYNVGSMNYEGYGFWLWGPLLPTNTYKTQLLKDANFKIDENSFYVDMEYNFITYAKAETVTYYPLDIYNYYLGRPGQSMSRESMIRNVRHHEKVTLRLLEELEKRRDSIDLNKQHYLINRLIIPMCKTQYYIVTELFKDGEHFKSFDEKLKQYPEFYNNPEIAGKIVRLHRKTGGASVRFDTTIRKTRDTLKRGK
ncbi:MAG TPA: glycosyltransferase [Candidatus Saccharimonadales bacterium]|nr:glycosyltransferase [Candidatus Saccharimonadales bacterium]